MHDTMDDTFFLDEPQSTQHRARGTRRKTLSPSKALHLSFATLDENQPPTANEGSAPVPIFYSTSVKDRRKTICHKPQELLQPNPEGPICLHHVVIAKHDRDNGSHEGNGQLWALPSNSGGPDWAPVRAQAAEKVWWTAIPRRGGKRRLSNVTNRQSLEDDKAELGNARDAQYEEPRIWFEMGKVTSVRDVDRGIMVDLTQKGGQDGPRSVHLEFQGTGFEAAQAKAKAALLSLITPSPPTLVSASTLPPISLACDISEKAQATLQGEIENISDIAALVRLHLKALPYSHSAKVIARQTYRLTGYPLMPMDLISSAAAGSQPQPSEGPRRSKMTMREMRAMVMNLDPMVREMNDVQGKQVQDSEERTQARAERTKEDGTYSYRCLITQQSISPAEYRRRYMATLDRPHVASPAASARASSSSFSSSPLPHHSNSLSPPRPATPVPSTTSPVSTGTVIFPIEGFRPSPKAGIAVSSSPAPALADRHVSCTDIPSTPAPTISVTLSSTKAATPNSIVRAGKPHATAAPATSLIAAAVSPPPTITVRPKTPRSRPRTKPTTAHLSEPTQPGSVPAQAGELPEEHCMEGAHTGEDMKSLSTPMPRKETGLAGMSVEESQHSDISNTHDSPAKTAVTERAKTDCVQTPPNLHAGEDVSKGKLISPLVDLEAPYRDQGDQEGPSGAVSPSAAALAALLSTEEDGHRLCKDAENEALIRHTEDAQRPHVVEQVTETTNLSAFLLQQDAASVPCKAIPPPSLPFSSLPSLLPVLRAVEPQRQAEVRLRAEERLRFSIDQALRAYHREVAVALAALVGDERHVECGLPSQSSRADRI